MRKKLYLVDVSSLFFRAFYAIRELTSPKGIPVNAVYGFLSMITKLLKEQKPAYCAFCYDQKDPGFRHEIDPNYKANRTEMPESLAQQIPYMKSFGKLLGIAEFELPSFEADDCIGTLAYWGRDHGFDVVIVSGDKDFAQLIGPHVCMLDTMKEVTFDEDQVVAKWGVRPEQFIDFLSLIGDSSDNVPGVPGVGPKTAEKLLKEYNTLENIYANLDKITAKALKAKMETGHESALRSKQLVTIRTDLPLNPSAEMLQMRPIMRAELESFLTELNFKALLKQLLGISVSKSAQDSTAKDSASAKSSEDGNSDGAAGDKAESASLGGHAINSAEVEAMNEQIVILDEASLQKYFPKASTVWIWESRGQLYIAKDKLIGQISMADVSAAIIDALSWRLSGYDIKLLAHELDLTDIHVEQDLMLMAYVVNAEAISSLGQIAKKYLGLESADFLSPASHFELLQSLAKELGKRLSAQQVQNIYSEIEQPLVEVLYDVERVGVLVDCELLKSQSESLQKDIVELESEIKELAGTDFNILSPKQLSEILFEKLNLPKGRKTKTGYSTDNEVLIGLDHPIAAKVLQFRELSKLKSTYVDALPDLVSPVDGRIHTRFNQAMTTTGRLSSENPNLQNIPIRTPRGQQIRKAFIAAPKLSLLSMDYSQIELRILAHVSQDPGLVNAFKNDVDVHTATAAEVFGKDREKVTPEDRRIAKAINFGIAYGQGAFGLGEALGVERKDAQEIIERYFEKFANVKAYIDDTIKSAYDKGYVETLFGRRRYLPELQSKNQNVRRFGERAAINAPMQGTAADLIKLAMIKIHRSMDLKMILQVHDELIFEDTRELLIAAKPKVEEIMENIVSYSVPLKVNGSIGNNWDEAH